MNDAVKVRFFCDNIDHILAHKVQRTRWRICRASSKTHWRWLALYIVPQTSKLRGKGRGRHRDREGKKKVRGGIGERNEVWEMRRKERK